jgi:hypothetical protein
MESGIEGGRPDTLEPPLLRLMRDHASFMPHVIWPPQSDGNTRSTAHG